MPVDPDDVAVGAVLRLNWPEGALVPHHGIVLMKFGREFARIAVATGGKWEDYPEEYREEIDWSAEPHRSNVSNWPKDFGKSYYYGVYVRDIPVDRWISSPGRAQRRKVYDIALMFERWQRDMLGY